MSYLNRWRKVRSLANTLAEGNSSEEDGTEPRPVGEEGGSESSGVDAAVSSDTQELISETDSDTDSRTDNSSEIESDDDLINAEAAESDEPTLREKLAEWATQNRLTRASVNELLGILREENLDLPKDARTLLQTPKEIPVENKCGGKYAYFGLKKGIEKTFNFASTGKY
ncbi:uncharacterized protein LOC128554855 [Mercenaria mercenaria]|uniref:uncharacterized protein LOC128554855 n=1 Tax=Mercenaria mercenaria TaxID=6596 RepID=UPI00234EAE48|nr:uncharacterized protein LOC128554855 [Mercenaria mercenaria]